jgi:hypothetical protein
MMKRKPIFVGGVGRSGTTMLKDAFAANPDVHSFSGELRWLTDPDGLGPLCETLTHAWSPFVADLALKRFKALLLDSLKMHYVAHFGFKSGAPLEQFIKRISQFNSLARYYGWRDGDTLETDPLIVQDDLPTIVQTFFDELFKQSDIQEEYWVEDTPETVAFFNTFERMFGRENTACFHAIRHPLDIIASIRGRQSRKDESQIWWWPREPYQIARRVRYVYDHWKHVQGSPGIVVKMESMVRNPENTMRGICTYAGLDYSPAMIQHISEEKAHIGRWKNDLTKSEVRQCLLVIAPVLREYGYKAE